VKPDDRKGQRTSLQRGLDGLGTGFRHLVNQEQPAEKNSRVHATPLTYPSHHETKDTHHLIQSLEPQSEIAFSGIGL